jgi:hypothetical protein
MVLTVEEQEDLVASPVVEARILEVLRNRGGHGRVSQIAEGVGRDVTSTNALLTAMERRKLVRQSGVWWRITDKGERIPPESPNGNSSRSSRGGASVKNGIDYAIVLEDLRRRRDEIVAAIAAIERLEA